VLFGRISWLSAKLYLDTVLTAEAKRGTSCKYVIKMLQLAPLYQIHMDHDSEMAQLHAANWQIEHVRTIPVYATLPCCTKIVARPRCCTGCEPPYRVFKRYVSFISCLALFPQWFLLHVIDPPLHELMYLHFCTTGTLHHPCYPFYSFRGSNIFNFVCE